MAPTNPRADLAVVADFIGSDCYRTHSARDLKRAKTAALDACSRLTDQVSSKERPNVTTTKTASRSPAKSGKTSEVKKRKTRRS